MPRAKAAIDFAPRAGHNLLLAVNEVFPYRP